MFMKFDDRTFTPQEREAMEELSKSVLKLHAGTPIPLVDLRAILGLALGASQEVLGETPEQQVECLHFMAGYLSCYLRIMDNGGHDLEQVIAGGAHMLISSQITELVRQKAQAEKQVSNCH